MSNNTSGFGLACMIAASNTTGNIPVPLSDWADDIDPLDFQELEIMEGRFGPNGNFIVNSKANPVTLVLAAIPGSITDNTLATILEANRPSQNKSSAYDIITLTIYYPDDLLSAIILSDGYIMKGTPGTGMGGSGRLKTKSYTFQFGSKTGGL